MTQLSPSTEEALRKGGLDPRAVVELAKRTLLEDLSFGPDITTESIISATMTVGGDFVARRAGILAGAPVAAAVMELASEGEARTEFVCDEGAPIVGGDVVMTVSGPARAILSAERSSLNFLCHLSGIATLTRAFVEAVSGTGAVIRDTRKTTPGLRVLEKYAVRCGGGENHRMGLGDGALIKDNHIEAAGSLRGAFDALADAACNVPIEVECDTLAQVEEALGIGATLILLDNMGVDSLKEAVAMAKAHEGVRLEVSGGVTLGEARELAATGVDYLAVGALTHSAPVLDIGLDLDLRK